MYLNTSTATYAYWGMTLIVLRLTQVNPCSILGIFVALNLALHDTSDMMAATFIVQAATICNSKAH